jgi:hypothetical protein
MIPNGFTRPSNYPARIPNTTCKASHTLLRKLPKI